jgi:polyhydroxyalkanoate synthesis regulator phasin
MTMVDLMKAVMLAGVGALEVGEERVRHLVDGLVRRGELAAEDAKALMELAAKRAEERRHQETSAVREAVAAELARQNVASQAALAALTERVAALEHTVAAQNEQEIQG